MDGDLQHDERLLPKMLQALNNGPCDLVIGSRYAPGGGVGRWNHRRTNISGVATRLSRLICKPGVADPMSGFFMVRRAVFESAVHNLSGRGFKILLDLLASSPRPVHLIELPFEFGRRQHCTSKLDTHAGWEFVMMLAEKRIGIVPLRLLLFACIGTVGLALHLGVLWAGLYALGGGFAESQALAAAVLINFTFLLGYLLTYRDQRAQGMRLVRSLLCFQLICAAGALANVGIAAHVLALRNLWWIAGTAGAAVGSVWNYAASLAVNHPRR
jgi:dolichol-phosphate mannosyltransferase